MPPSGWKLEDTLKFIELYRSQECLWKYDDQYYKLQFHTNQAIKHIVESMKMKGFTIFKCKQKIKNLRAHYRAEVKKMQNDKKYVPSLVWFKDVHNFLKDYLDVDKINKYRVYLNAIIIFLSFSLFYVSET